VMCAGNWPLQSLLTFIVSRTTDAKVAVLFKSVSLFLSEFCESSLIRSQKDFLQ